MPELVFHGCRPTPLASYLKSLGALRIVSEQADPDARGWWSGNVFHLRSHLDESSVVELFAASYEPAPLIAPWNGGSGFYRKDNTTAIDTISDSISSRFATYRQAISEAKCLLQRLGIQEKVEKHDKPMLLEACRATLSDSVVRWLDAAFALASGEDGSDVKYPPLLGTGGNDGRLEFTNNFMQRLLDLIDPGTGAPTPQSSELVRAALFDAPTDLLAGGAIGFFSPSGAGGANLEASFDGGSLFNPWDFVLMLEGAIVFSSGVVRKLEREQGALVAPFTVRSAAAGYDSAADTDRKESRGEIWMPLWSSPASAREVATLLSEGRARVGDRTARNGVDFARAVATLGVDRGIDSLQRFGFQVRNGLSYLATPLGRVEVKPEPSVHLLDEIDRWLDGLNGFRRRASDDRAPSSVKQCLRDLDRAIMELCRRGASRLLDVLIALGRCERALAKSFRWTLDQRVSPVPMLSKEWLAQVEDSIELRLASSLSSVRLNLGPPRGFHASIRGQLEPVRLDFRKTQRVRWDEVAEIDVVWRAGNLIGSMNQTFKRRMRIAERFGAASWLDAGVGANLHDIARFIDGDIDEAKLEELLWACLLVDRRGHEAVLRRGESIPSSAPGLYALLKLCFPGAAASARPMVPIVPRIHRLAESGQGSSAARAAIARLRASGLAPAITQLRLEGEAARRTAAALLFPLSTLSLDALADNILRASPAQDETASGELVR